MTRVALYEDGERLVLHREGEPLAWVVSESFDRGFAQDAERLAAGDTQHWDSDAIELSHFQSDRLGEAVALWEDGQVSLSDRSRTGEIGWRARHYIGSELM